MVGSLALPAHVPSPTSALTVAIGGIPISIETDDLRFHELLTQRYVGFIDSNASCSYVFNVEITQPSAVSGEDIRVYRHGRLWRIERGDFRAELDLRTRRGWVQQASNPYSIDTVLRITHSLALAEEGGFLLHSASTLRYGHAFLFAGISGAGKTTISRLAPPDAVVLTDEISYVRRHDSSYRAYGTPFTGELARVGENCSAPLQTLFFLRQGAAHRIDPVDPRDAARELLRHILFFAHDADLVQRVFNAALDFVSCVNMARLTFAPNPAVWELIR
jgi:hypothetical protein